MKYFLETFTPSADCVKPSADYCEKYIGKLPAYIIELWQETGIGKYNHGLIELILPEKYESSLALWLGKKNEHYVPIAITGFGELLYYRKLADGEEDVCILDIQYRKVEVLSWNLESFFEDFLTKEPVRKEWLREDLFIQAHSANGALKRNEVFTFVPILAMGGGEELSCLQKGDAAVYMNLVFQMTS